MSNLKPISETVKEIKNDIFEHCSSPQCFNMETGKSGKPYAMFRTVLFGNRELYIDYECIVVLCKECFKRFKIEEQEKQIYRQYRPFLYDVTYLDVPEGVASLDEFGDLNE